MSDSTVAIPDCVLAPMRVDAFVFNEAVCNGGPNEAKIAPITQPNYTFLRLEKFYIQNDILDHIDLHAASPATKNSRFTDLRTGQPRLNRQGVYLHWVLPRMYRVGTVTQQDGNFAPNSRTQLAPNRWLIVRHIDAKSIEPKDATIEEFDAWIVESDLKQDLNRDLTEDHDMQVDVSPFVAADDKENLSIPKQAEVFIGKKFKFHDWTETPGKPRVAVSLFNSSNQLFPDYQPHNSNVFSMVDPVQSSDGKKLSKAKMSYYVIGWHAEEANDPLCLDGSTSRDDKLKKLFLALKDETTEGVKNWLANKSSTQVICHGAMYGVEWDFSKKPPKVPADEYAQKLNDRLPIAIGETPIDAMLAFVDAHKSIDTGRAQQLETSIDAIRVLLRSRDDGVESQRQAEDALSSTHYMTEEGGVEYHLTGSGEAGRGASDSDKLKLLSLNKAQALLDSAIRTKRQMQWDMFSLWWKHLSEPNAEAKVYITRDKVRALGQQAKVLEQQIKDLSEDISKWQKELPDAKPAAMPPFYRVLDPTLLVGGINSGWPHDYLDNLIIRVTGQILHKEKDSDASTPIPSLANIVKDVKAKLPESVASSALGLLQEFVYLDPASELVDTSFLGVVPLFHDQLPIKAATTDLGWRDRWEGTQPWFPLFMEWEAEYTDVPFDEWELQETTSSRSTVERLSYRIKEGVELATLDLPDRRLVSGRTLILPQPTVSLRLIISQLFADTPSTVLDQYLEQPKRDDLKDGFEQLAFLSAPLSGFIDHLTTKFQGSHIKPFAKLPDGKVTIKDALDASKAAGFEAENLAFIGDETDLTPYGTSVPAPKGVRMFMPVTHGQFRLTKVNIVDKFGQVIHAINPSVPPNQAAPLYPCISERLRPQALGSSSPPVANTVFQDEPGKCEFVQLRPRINQLARINAHFIEVSSDGSKANRPLCRRMREDENPVWGWVVINFPNRGLQIFQPDGSFYREICFGGPKGTMGPENWLPFAPPKNAATLQSEPNYTQLQAFIEQLKDPNYLEAFVKMIQESARNSPAAPNAYAETLNSLVGKPLALVNAGWSLELATNELQNQSGFQNDNQDRRTLLGKSDPPSNRYEFPLKIGDKNRLFDGMIGYFSPKTVEKAKAGDFYELSTLNTFYVSDHAGQTDPRSELLPSNYPRVRPTWVPPFDQEATTKSSEHPVTFESYSKAYDSKLKIVGAVIDPFVATNVFTGIMPPKPLRLLPWVWQDALRKMTAFFRLGPMIMTEDVPAYNKDSALTDNWRDVEPVRSAVRIHTTQSVDWAYLQPYVVEDNSDKDGATKSGTAFMPLTVDQVEPGLRFESGPYTAIEGYLQMRRAMDGPTQKS